MTDIIYESHDGPILIARCKEDLLYMDKGLQQEVFFTIYLKDSRNDKEIEMGHTRMSPMPGCCGIVVSHDTFLIERYRSSNYYPYYSKCFRLLKEEMAKKLGYSCMIATTQMSNIPAVKNFFKSRYRFVDTFTNKRTTNLIGIGIKKV